MRAVSLHPDALLVTSAVWQTNCTIVRHGEEAFAIDSPVLPSELEALPALLEQASFPKLNGLLATHGDWDHLLGRLVFPQAALGCAPETVARLRAAPGVAQRELRAFDEEHYVPRRAPLSLGHVQELAVPGRCEIGGQQLELHPAAGHTRDGMAVLAEWAGVLIAGDYLSAVEIPVFGEGGDALAYAATLALLEGLVRRAEHVVPGHGPVLDRERALALLEEDRAYVAALGELGAEAELPRGRRTPTQRRRHAENAALLG